MEKEQAIRMLGFRDPKGTLVDPTTVLDLSKTYRVCLSAENGSWKPTGEELSRLGGILQDLGIKGGIYAEMGTGGTSFFNKGGVVICRFVESRVDAPPPPKKAEPAPAPVLPPAPAPAPEIAPEEKKAVQEVVEVAKKDPEGAVFSSTQPHKKKKKF
jgi:hypothetical protein